ncbi:hypothetical protein A9Q84_20245 [Halobacteriovorax marinus]|uniref:Lipoprotein n=1 Tax=Halobacteriovorax marinus TaxID=97084 RepID=A0A1Y5F147_9BACT|nr:hypothetical protein A9Q84_20245 [Halobacteriovorax marinus]
MEKLFLLILLVLVSCGKDSSLTGEVINPPTNTSNNTNQEDNVRRCETEIVNKLFNTELELASKGPDSNESIKVYSKLLNDLNFQLQELENCKSIN